jgi:hypothetical protein
MGIENPKEEMKQVPMAISLIIALAPLAVAKHF